MKIAEVENLGCESAIALLEVALGFLNEGAEIKIAEKIYRLNSRLHFGPHLTQSEFIAPPISYVLEELCIP